MIRWQSQRATTSLYTNIREFVCPDRFSNSRARSASKPGCFAGKLGTQTQESWYLDSRMVCARESGFPNFYFFKRVFRCVCLVAWLFASARFGANFESARNGVKIAEQLLLCNTTNFDRGLACSWEKSRRNFLPFCLQSSPPPSPGWSPGEFQFFLVFSWRWCHMMLRA